MTCAELEWYVIAVAFLGGAGVAGAVIFTVDTLCRARQIIDKEYIKPTDLARDPGKWRCHERNPDTESGGHDGDDQQ